MSLVTGADPEYIIRVAAVSPTFGRLFEGTDEASSGQTSQTPMHQPEAFSGVATTTSPPPEPGTSQRNPRNVAE